MAAQGKKSRGLSAAFRSARRAAADAEIEHRSQAEAAARREAAPPPFAALEALTRQHRHRVARRHREKASEAARDYRAAVAEWAEDPEDPTRTIVCREVATRADTRSKWHRGRARGQTRRFLNVRGCGTRFLAVACTSCKDRRAPRAEGCGVTRVCDRCALAHAKRRRARFGRARARILIESSRYGTTVRNRLGGRYTEKMLTLTLPHARLADAEGEVAELATNDTHARILAAWLAWPLFLRNFKRHWTKRVVIDRQTGEVQPAPERWVTYHRAFEWTPGDDGFGHPHFHVYLWCPWIDRRQVQAWWADALRAVGWPVATYADGADVVRVDLRIVSDMNRHMVRELMKAGDGRRAALQLSRLDLVGGAPVHHGGGKLSPTQQARRGGGNDVYVYAEGWTIADIMYSSRPEVVAHLYEALEGKRLAQASRGFFVEDPPCECPLCGGRSFRVTYAPAPTIAKTRAPSRERGPPDRVGGWPASTPIR